jgi:hypothetical protein
MENFNEEEDFNEEKWEWLNEMYDKMIKSAANGDYGVSALYWNIYKPMPYVELLRTLKFLELLSIEIENNTKIIVGEHKICLN